MAEGKTNPAFQPDNGVKVSPRPVAEPEYDDTVDLRFNLGFCKSAALGKLFSNLYVFILCVGLCGLTARILPASLGGLMKDLSAQYDLSPLEFASFSMFQNIGMTITVIFIAYIGKKAPIPFFCGILAMTQGILFCSPAIMNYMRPYYLPDAAEDDAVKAFKNRDRLCKKNIIFAMMDRNTLNRSDLGTYVAKEAMGVPMKPEDMPVISSETEGRDDLSYNSLLMTVFMSGMIQPAFLVLPPIFIDNNTVNKKVTGMLLGLTTVIMELASPIGLLVNTAITKIPIDLEPTSLEYDDPQFVGAWWIPLLGFGLVSILLSLPLLGMPANLVSKKRQQEALEEAKVTFAGGKAVDVDVAEKTVPNGQDLAPPMYHKKHSSVGHSEAHLSPQYKGHLQPRASISGDVVYLAPAKDKNTSGWQDMAASLGQFPTVAKRLFKNPIFDLLLIWVVVITTVFRGAEMFRFTYPVFEFNWDKNESMFAFTIGLSCAMVLGTSASAAISSRITKRSGYALVMVLSFVLVAGVTPINLFFPCENTPIYGLNDTVVGHPIETSERCYCTTENPDKSFGPVCGMDGHTYYNPCFAECVGGKGTEAEPLIKCQNVDVNATEPHNALFGSCDPGCSTGFWAYVIIFCVGIFAFQCSLIPAQLLMIRSLAPEDRAFGIGSIFFTMQLVAIPTPKMFGMMFSYFGCRLSFSSGMCVVYDRDNLRYVMSGTDTACYATAALVVLFVFIISLKQERKANMLSKQYQAPTIQVQYDNTPM